VLAGGIALLGLTPTAGQALGVSLVTAGLLLVRGLRGGTSGPLRDVALAVLIAAIISAYTLIDREGVRYVSPVTYFWLVLVGPGVVFLGWLWRRRGVAAVRAEFGPAILVAGVANFAAFTMVLTALTLALPAAVSAVRESSVVMATALAAVVLRESVDRARLAGSVVVVLGVALVALG
jgi:drug/metabolite transporter (DMT)-like permease